MSDEWNTEERLKAAQDIHNEALQLKASVDAIKKCRKWNNSHEYRGALIAALRESIVQDLDVCSWLDAADYFLKGMRMALKKFSYSESFIRHAPDKSLDSYRGVLMSKYAEYYYE